MYVVFTNTNRPEGKLLKQGFQHVYAVRNDYDKVWTVIQPGHKHLSIEQELVSDYPTILDYVLEGETVLKYNVTPSRYAHSLNIVTCVGVVKYLLGIRAARVLTPYQLYKYLLPRGELVK
jgi:hypothetical protein